MGSSDNTEGPRRRFGDLLKKIRGQRGLTQQELATASMVGQSTISDLEKGKKGTRRDNIVRLDDALTARKTLLDAWDAAFLGAGMTAYFREVAEAEQEADRIREYSLGLIPGLLQTEGYVRALTEVGKPEATPDQVDKIVKARKQRQLILDRKHPPAMTVLLDEVVLRRRFRDPQVMKDQIDHLLKQSHRPRMKIQIVPIATEGHPGLGESFRMTDESDGTFVYVESQETGVLLRQSEIVAVYERIFADLGNAALPEPASRTMMEEIRGGI